MKQRMKVGTPAHDLLAGALVRIGYRRWMTLIVGAGDRPAPGQNVRTGDLAVCYAVPYLFEQRSFVPHVVIDDFGREYTGNAALNFMVQRGDAFPRADVYGHWVGTGEQDHVFLKQLDLAARIEAFGCESASAPIPLARLDAVVWAEDEPIDLHRLDENDDRAPELLRRAIPVYRIGASRLQQLPGMLSAALDSGPGK
jgi:hypothetical protein